MSPTSSTNKPENDEKNSSIVKPPSSFDGSHSKYHDWLCQVKLFHRGKHLTADDDKIISTLSYMTEGSAATWAQRYADDHLDSPSMGKWDEFAAELDSSFKDHTATKKARDKVEHFVQGKVLIDEFMNSFEMLLADAELSDDAEQIRLLEKNVNRSIIDTIYGSGNLPSNFGDYKKRVLKIGHLWEQRREQSEMVRKSYPYRPPQPPSRSFAPIVTPTPTLVQHPPTPAPSDHKTPTGIVYGGQGRPMDVDHLKRTNRCFGCGQIGHYRRDCPKPPTKLNVRTVMSELTGEELEEMRKELFEEEPSNVDEISEPAQDFVEDQ